MSIEPRKFSLVDTLALGRIRLSSDEARHIYESITSRVMMMDRENQAMDLALKTYGGTGYTGGTTLGSPDDDDDDDYEDYDYDGPIGTTSITSEASEQGANGPNGPTSSDEVSTTGPDGWEVVDRNHTPLPGLREVLKGSREFARDIFRDMLKGTLFP